MHLHEDAVDTGRDRRAREWCNEFPLSARFIAGTTRKLRRMGRIEDHRISEAAHDDEAAHIGHQVVVAE